MMLSCVVDPSLFDSRSIKERNIEGQLLRFIDGARVNCLLVVDQGGHLFREYALGLEQLVRSSSRSQRIAILFTEMLKERRRHFVGTKVAREANTKPIEFLRKVRAQSAADVLITSNEHHADGEPIVEIETYDISDFEANRARWAAGSHTLDEMKKADVEKMFLAALRWSSEITIVDKQIGKLNNSAAFQKSLGFIVSMWRKSADRKGHTFSIKIITSPFIEARPTDTVAERNAIGINNLEKSKELKRRLIEPLFRDVRDFKLKVSVEFKEDISGRRILHDRYVDNGYRVFSFSLGFDLFDPHGQFCRQQVAAFERGSSHIGQCNALPNLVPTIVSFN